MSKQNRNTTNKSEAQKEIIGWVLTIVCGFLLLCVVIPVILGPVSGAITGLLWGVFGFSIYPILLCFFIAGIFLIKGYRLNTKPIYIVGISLVSLLFIFTLHLATTFSFLYLDFAEYISQVYSGFMADGPVTAGGVLFGIVVYGVQSAITPVVSFILYGIGIVALSFMMLNKRFGILQARKAVVTQKREPAFIKTNSPTTRVVPLVDKGLFVQNITPKEQSASEAFVSSGNSFSNLNEKITTTTTATYSTTNPLNEVATTVDSSLVVSNTNESLVTSRARSILLDDEPMLIKKEENNANDLEDLRNYLKTSRTSQSPISQYTVSTTGEKYHPLLSDIDEPELLNSLNNVDSGRLLDDITPPKRPNKIVHNEPLDLSERGGANVAQIPPKDEEDDYYTMNYEGIINASFESDRLESERKQAGTFSRENKASQVKKDEVMAQDNAETTSKEKEPYDSSKYDSFYSVSTSPKRETTTTNSSSFLDTITSYTPPSPSFVKFDSTPKNTNTIPVPEIAQIPLDEDIGVGVINPGPIVTTDGIVPEDKYIKTEEVKAVVEKEVKPIQITPPSLSIPVIPVIQKEEEKPKFIPVDIIEEPPATFTSPASYNPTPKRTASTGNSFMDALFCLSDLGENEHLEDREAVEGIHQFKRYDDIIITDKEAFLTETKAQEEAVGVVETFEDETVERVAVKEVKVEPIIETTILTQAVEKMEVIDKTETKDTSAIDFSGYREQVSEYSIKDADNDLEDRIVGNLDALIEQDQQQVIPEREVGFKPSKTRTISKYKISDGQVDMESFVASKAEQEPVKKKKKKKTRYITPSLDLLRPSINAQQDDSEADKKMMAEKIVDTLAEFKLPVEVTNIVRGPSVTRYELRMPTGIPITKIESYDKDIRYNLESVGKIRIETPIPGKKAVGIEVPNNCRDLVSLRETLESNEFTKSKSALAVGIGKDIGGVNIVCEIDKMPHMLIAGSTGSGKSVCINSLIVSLVYKSSPDDVRLILVDPKMVELKAYEGMPHLLTKDIICTDKKALNAFKWLVAEMERRYIMLSKHGKKNITEYNTWEGVVNGDEEKLPYILLIVDELADLMTSSYKKELEENIMRIAQKARAAGIHLVLATQRPTTDVVTGTIKANLPSRIAFSLKSNLDSRIVLDSNGAETLQGKGDMLYAPMGLNEPQRVQGAIVSSEEIDAVISFIKANNEADFDEEFTESLEKEETSGLAKGDGDEPYVEYDPLMPDILKTIIEMGTASTSFIQRRFAMGYAKAARIMDYMEIHGYIGASDGQKPRPVHMTMEEFNEKFGKKDSEYEE